MKVVVMVFVSAQLAPYLLIALRAWSGPLSEESTGWDRLELTAFGAYVIAAGAWAVMIVISLLRLIGRLTRGEDVW